MRVQDIVGNWYEIDDAILANCEVKMDQEPSPAEKPPAADSKSGEKNVDSPSC